ncbi:hypothetical protein [Marinitoga lauensis]|uniref:hypothetical protein n=1 Tax=Marinitoga lauensis TaxID=2201189 RepID=UPI001010C477|nr:hypothetical protein [Marinitoga lauensis]
MAYGKTYYIKLIAFDNLNESSKKTLSIKVADLGFYNFSPSGNANSIPVDKITLKWIIQSIQIIIH